MRLKLFDGLVWHSSQLDKPASQDRDTVPEEVDGDLARRHSFLEIMSTADRLAAEWDESDRIDRIVRLAARLDEPKRAGHPRTT